MFCMLDRCTRGHAAFAWPNTVHQLCTGPAGRFQLPRLPRPGTNNLEEHLELAKERGFAIIPEIKQAFAVNKILAQRGIQNTIENLTLHELAKHGYESADDLCFIQTFEFSTLKALSESGSDLRRVFLANHVDLLSEEWISKYKELGIYGVGVDKNLIVVKNPNGHINFTNIELMDRLHGHGLQVFSWTFRNEHDELSSWDDGQDPYVEYQRFFDAGLDGFFTDFPGSLKRFFNTKEIPRM